MATPSVYQPAGRANLAELAQARQEIIADVNSLGEEVVDAQAAVRGLEEAFKEAKRIGAPVQMMRDLRDEMASAKKELAGAKGRFREARGELAANAAAGQKEVGLQQKDRDKEDQARADAAKEFQGQLAAVGSFLAGGFLGSLAAAGQAMTSFVGALNPAAVQVFGLAMKDLSAVVGTALMPVFNVLAQTVREVSSLLFPLAKEMAPIFGKLAQTALQVLQPGLQSLANIVRAVLPVFSLLADVVAGLAPLFQTASTLIAAGVQTLGDLFRGLFGEDVKSPMQAFQNAMIRLANYAIIAAGALAKMAGADSFLRNLIEASRGGRKESAEGLGAATSGRTTDFAGFGKSQLAAAFTAAPGAGSVKTQAEYLKEAVDVLTKMQSGQIDARAWLKDRLKDVSDEVIQGLGELLGGILQALKGHVHDAVKESVDRGIKNPSTAGGVAGGAIAGPAGIIAGRIVGGALGWK